MLQMWTSSPEQGSSRRVPVLPLFDGHLAEAPREESTRCQGIHAQRLLATGSRRDGPNRSGEDERAEPGEHYRYEPGEACGDCYREGHTLQGRCGKSGTLHYNLEKDNVFTRAHRIFGYTCQRCHETDGRKRDKTPPCDGEWETIGNN